MGPHMSRGAGALSQLCRHDAYASRALSPDDSRQDRALASLDEERGQVGALLLAWYWAHKKGKDRTIDVRSYTNCESVELFLNGKSKGRKDRQPNTAPMTYMHEGRQYIVLSVAGEGFPAEHVALALPEE